MARYQPHLIPLAEGVLDPQGRIMRWDDGFVYPDDRMQHFAQKYIAGEDIGQLRYSRMISEFGEWLQRNPSWISENVRAYWTDESYAALRLLDRHYHMIGAKRDPDDEVEFMGFAIGTDFRGYRSRKDAQAVHTKALATLSDQSIAESFGLPGTINSKASRHAGAAFMTLLTVMHDANEKGPARVSAANSVLERLAGKPQTFLPPLPIDITGMTYTEAVKAVMQQCLQGFISLEQAKSICELLVAIQGSKVDALEERLNALEAKEDEEDGKSVVVVDGDRPWFPDPKLSEPGVSDVAT